MHFVRLSSRRKDVSCYFNNNVIKQRKNKNEKNFNKVQLALLGVKLLYKNFSSNYVIFLPRLFGVEGISVFFQYNGPKLVGF